MKKINLLPDEYKKKVLIKKIITFLSIGIMITLLPFILSFAILEGVIHWKTNALNELRALNQNYTMPDNDYETILKLLSERDQYRQFAQVVDLIPQADISHLITISDVLPENVFLTNITISGTKKEISIAGYSSSRKNIALFLENLSNLKDYTQISLKELSFQSEKNINYSIELVANSQDSD